MAATGPPMADVLGIGGRYRDPLWRVGVDLSPLEQEVLRCAPVRRLAFVAFAGASSIASTQSGSRLEHPLGVFALVAHLAPDDPSARAAALLHDVGHLPLSHTLEGVRGLDHLDGLVRSARSHGRSRRPPPALLAHPATAAATRQLRRDPTSWRIAEAHDDRPGQVVTVRRLSLNLPLVDGRPMSPPTAFADLPEVPATFAVLPPDTPATVSPVRPSPASSSP